MKPVAILRFSATEGPGHFGEYLAARAIPFELLALDRGEAVPASPDGFSGIGMMGGPMSVNDPLPWVEPVCALLRTAVRDRVPVIGHCLGGQLLSRALGGSVTRAEVAEVGWWPVRAAGAEAAAWFGGRSDFDVFQWHNETFTVPPGALPLLTGDWCRSQAYVVDGRHLGLQCHIEMTRALVEQWCRDGACELASPRGPAIQSRDEILRDLDARLVTLNGVADDVYARWTAGLVGLRSSPLGGPSRPRTLR
jgi:GMP synthase-like glutamine amidotransferase